MAAPNATGQWHELAALAPVAVRRCHGPFRRTVRQSVRGLPLALPTIPELPELPSLPGSPVPSDSSSGGSTLPPPLPSALPSALPTPLPTPLPWSPTPSSSPTPSPEPTPATLNRCCVCLARTEPASLVRGDPSDPRFPLASRCLDCVARDGGLDPGRRYELVSGEELWVCRWCGGAEPLDLGGWDGVEFHPGCRAAYARALRDHWWTFAVQWFLLLVLGWLCFGSFGMVEAIKQDVFLFSVATCLLSALGLWRSVGYQVYQLPLLVEANRLTALVDLLFDVVWTASSSSSLQSAAPEDGSVDEAPGDSGQVSPHAAALATMLIIWLLFHSLFSLLGHMIVYYEWRMWRRGRPGVGFWRRGAEEFMLLLVVWADPFVVEHGFSPRWWLGVGRWVRNLGGKFRGLFRGRGGGLPQ